MLEVVAACVLLGALTTACMQFFVGVVQQRRACLQRQTAIQEAANLAEQISAWSWNEATSQQAAGLGLSPQGRRALPGGQVEVKVDEPAGAPPAKRVTVLVRWQAGPEGACLPVRLVTWKYRTTP